jgi:hypothetical protein
MKSPAGGVMRPDSVTAGLAWFGGMVGVDRALGRATLTDGAVKVQRPGVAEDEASDARRRRTRSGSRVRHSARLEHAASRWTDVRLRCAGSGA